MELVQALLQSAAQQALGTLSLPHGDGVIELGGTWPRLTMRDAVLSATGVDILAAADLESLRRALSWQGIDPGEAKTWALLVDEVFSEVEPTLPAHFITHPYRGSPLAKRLARTRVVERFELFSAGMEVANAFSELNDPEDQRARFEEQSQLAAAGDAEAHPMDEDFLIALEHGMPPTGGLGVGVDRLVRIFANAPNLREVILFPHLRPEGS
jgi:lysyl-tRNA synthetase class 2